jgi:ankyrin repeat protein
VESPRTTQKLSNLIQRGADICHRQRDGATPIFQAATCGNEQSVKYLLGENCLIPGDQKVDLDRRNSRRSTPLSFAAAKGHESVVLLLLTHGARDVSQRAVSKQKDLGRRDPLSWAAGHGMVDAVKALLAIPDLLVDSVDETLRTPLSWAAGKGQSDVVRQLLEPTGRWGSKANVNSVDIDNRTPLSWAAGAGHEHVVNLLLGYGANPTMWSKSLGSPITWAAIEGHKKTISILLQSHRIRDEDLFNNSGGSLMVLAAQNGKAETVTLLLDQTNPEVNNPNRRNKDGFTPLLLAASWGHDDVVRILLERGADVHLAKPDSKHTALSLAIVCGDLAIVDMLIKHNDSVLQITRPNGETPLYLAVSGGHYEIVKLLLDSKCDPNIQTTRTYYTLLHAAAERGHFLVLDQVLKRIGHRFTSQDAYGRTPLMLAVQNGHPQAITTLLRYAQEMHLPEKDLLIQDHRKQSILMAAVQSGRLTAVRIILGLVTEESGILDSKDRDGWTPLTCAAMLGNSSILRLLLRPENVNEEDPDSHMTPLLWASQYGNEEVIRLLLNSPSLNSGLNRYTKSESQCTSLWLAVREGHLNIVKLLLQDHSPQPALRKEWLNAIDRFPGFRFSPLQLSVRFGYTEMVRLLLAEQDVEINAQDNIGLSVFLTAINTGNTHLVMTLAEASTIDVNLKDHERHSALMLACQGGHLPIVKYLLKDCEKFSVPIDDIDNEGMSALSHAASKADPAIVQLLIDSGASVSQTVPPYNRNLLMLAANQNGSVQVVDMLSERLFA